MHRSRWGWFVLVACLAILSASTWWAILFPSFIPMPQVSIIVLIYMAMCGPGSLLHPAMGREIDVSVVVGSGCFLGYVTDVISGSPVGLQATLLALFALGLRVIFSQLLIRGWVFSMVIAVLVGALYQLALYWGWMWLDRQISWSGWHQMPWLCLSTLIATPIVLRWLRKIDAWFSRVPRGTLVS